MNIIGVLLVLSIMIGAMPWAAEQYERSTTNGWARSTGNDLAEFAAGLRGFIANVQNTPSIMPGAPVVGANWLKAPSCGGLAVNPPDGYIPCNFGGIGGFDTVFDASYNTTFTRNAATNYIEARVTFVPQMPSNPGSRGNVADVIVNTALENNPTPSNGMFVNFMSNVPITANDLTARPGVIANPASPDFGRVLLIASNAPSGDLWLRVDGTNQMLAAINAGGHDLSNARHIDASGNAKIQGIVEVGKDLRVLNNASVKKDASIGNDLFVGRDAAITRDAAIARDALVGRDVKVSNGSVLVTNGTAGDGAGLVIADDVAATDSLLSNGASPRLSQGIFEARVIPGNPTNINKPTCPPASTAQIFTSYQSTVSPDGYPIHASTIRVTNNGASWLVEPLVQTTVSGGLVPAPGSHVVISTKCS